MSFAQNNEEKSSETQAVIDVISRDFASTEADLRLRSSDGIVFHVFSRILVEASPVFRDMVSLPKYEQAPRDMPGLPSLVNLSEDAETLDLVLRFIYPMPDPLITAFDVLKRLMKAADKYLLEGTAHSLRAILVSPIFVEREPLRAYAIACMYGYEAEAKIASRHCLKTDIVLQGELHDELAMISARDLFRLIKLHQTRGAAILSILNGQGPSSCPGNVESSMAGPIWWLEFKNRAKEEIRLRPLSEVIFQPGFLAACVNVAVGSGCSHCAVNYLSTAAQARLISLKERIDALPDTV